MRSIWLYSLSGQVQEKRIAEGKALRFYQQAIERLSKPLAERAPLPQDDFIPCPDAGILRQQASPAGPTASEHCRKPSGAMEWGPGHRHRW